MRININNNPGYIRQYISNNEISSEISESVINDIKLIGFTALGFKFGFTYNNKTEFFGCSFGLKESYILHEIFHKLKLWDYEISLNRNTWGSLICILKLYINTEFIDQYLENSIALRVCVVDEYYNNLKSLGNNSSINNNSFIPYNEGHKQPKDFNINLYNYQKKSLKKMLSIENSVIFREIEQTTTINFYDTNILFEQIRGVVVNKKVNCKIISKGGILADEMGLGKTITSLSLICSNKSRLQCKFKEEKLYSKGTLLLCPSQLARQWLREVNKCSNNIKTIIITTKRQHEKISYQDIAEADLIIVSHQFLMNFKYYPRLDYLDHVTASSFNFSHRNDFLKNKLLNMRNVDNYLETNNTRDLEKEWNGIKKRSQPILEHFYYHRIMIDEGHEIFGQMLSNGSVSNYISTWLKNIQSDNYWYISGTPFVNRIGMINCLDFIKLRLVTDFGKEIRYNKSNIRLYRFLEKRNFIDNILSQVCIRHRKDDVNNQIEILGYNEKVIWVELTELEKKLYDTKKKSVSSLILQKMCCHPLVAESFHQVIGNESVSLDLMKDKLIDYHESKIKYYKHKLDNLNPDSTEYHMLKSTFTNKYSESNYILKVLKNITNNETDINENKDCVICFSTMENPALTPCGHLFCHECIQMCLKIKKLCPVCKKDLKGKEILLVDNKVNENNNNKIEETNPLIKKYGSKLGKIISLVRKLVIKKETRIIIFSQWDRMLNLIGKSLAENGIENSFVKGNVWARNSAINKFKLGLNKDGSDNKVIMLSLKNAASGTNLTEATHIFFVEPINAKIEEWKSIEGQAIGRACRLGQKNKVEVIRVLTKNTIEDEIYNRSYINNENVIIQNNNEEIVI